MKTFDPTKPVQTRDGRNARIVATLNGGRTFPILAVLTDEDGGEAHDTFDRNGSCYGGEPCGDDLVNVPERSERFFAVYAFDKPLGGKPSWATEEGATSSIVELPARDHWLLSQEEDRFGIIVTYEDGKTVSVELVNP